MQVSRKYIANKAQRQDLFCQVAHIHPFLGHGPGSQLKACRVRGEDRVVLIRQKEQLKELNQQTGLKQTKPKQKQPPKPPKLLHQRSLSAANFPPVQQHQEQSALQSSAHAHSPKHLTRPGSHPPQTQVPNSSVLVSHSMHPSLKAGSATTLRAIYSLDQAHKNAQWL